jgi:hypothetical protein
MYKVFRISLLDSNDNLYKIKYIDERIKLSTSLYY